MENIRNINKCRKGVNSGKYPRSMSPIWSVIKTICHYIMYLTLKEIVKLMVNASNDHSMNRVHFREITAAVESLIDQKEEKSDFSKRKF